jgi:sortase A
MRPIHAIALALMLLGAGGLGCGLYLPAKAVLAQHLLHRAWERSAVGPVRPWPWARTWPVARLEVPHLGIDQIVLAGAQGAALAFAPGHVDGTAQPDEHGNIVLAGHRDTVFAFLARVGRGDELLLETHSGRKRRFVVVSTAVVREDDTTALEPTTVDVLTLITCYPLDATRPGGPLRYILRAVEEPNWSSAIPG